MQDYTVLFHKTCTTCEERVIRATSLAAAQKEAEELAEIGDFDYDSGEVEEMFTEVIKVTEGVDNSPESCEGTA